MAAYTVFGVKEKDAIIVDAGPTKFYGVRSRGCAACALKSAAKVPAACDCN